MNGMAIAKYGSLPRFQHRRYSMKKSVFVILLILASLVIGALVCHAQQDPANVGTPAFKPLQSKSMNMTLKYGFLGASVYDASTKKWEFHKMTTITRSKVEGYVNMISDNFALAAGLHEVSLYDYSKHRWFTYKKGCDDSTGMLNKNFEMTKDYVKVKTLNGPWIKYTTAAGWQEVAK
jgi:hypothetical protein